MSFKLNESAIGALLNSTVGPVGIYIGRKADEVSSLASQRASGQVLGIESGRLLAGMRTQLEGTPEGVRAVVGTDAVAYDRKTGETRLYHGAPFSYPAFHDQGNVSGWLTGALAEVFPG
jgi:hypothetical protein